MRLFTILLFLPLLEASPAQESQPVFELRDGDGVLFLGNSFFERYYIGTHVETLYGPRRLNGGGLWSYDTRSRKLEIYSRGLINPWGMIFDRWGQTFQTDGAGGEGINYTFPDSVFVGSPLENRFLRGTESRASQTLWDRNHQREPLSRRMAGKPARQRLSRQQHRSLHA